tara:strand:- start:1591 stop:1749 length:159 start_codon:yes stop_codon:yes gene_type:complete
MSAAYYAMVAAKEKAKKLGGKYTDYIQEEMEKRGYSKDSYSGKGVWNYRLKQ